MSHKLHISSKCPPSADIKISKVDELRRTKNEWADLNNTVCERLLSSGASVYALVFELEADISSI